MIIKRALYLKLTKNCLAEHWWLTPIILASQEAVTRRIMVSSQPRFIRPYLKHTQHKTGLLEWLK
jgi:hypothetical protein